MPLPVLSPSQTPGGRNLPLVSVTNWHNRARRNVASRVFGGSSACIASRCRKSSRAGLASSQSGGWSSTPAAVNSRQTRDGSSGLVSVASQVGQHVVVRVGAGRADPDQRRGLPLALSQVHHLVG